MRLLFISLLLFLPLELKSQNQARPQPYGAWISYTGDNKINSKFGVHSEAQSRNFGIKNTLEQYLIRVGINYYLTPTSMITAGYGVFYTQPTNQSTVGSRVFENRAWEQLILRHRYNNVFIEHRYRLEQRFIQNLDSKQSTSNHRIRYRFQTTFPLYSISTSLKHYFINCSNEIFLNLGRKVSGELFDRNRFYVAVGYQFSPKINLQLGYLNQTIGIPNQDVYDVNHNLQIGLLYNLDLEFIKFPTKSGD
ncbi:MAG: DUF2490 domain-containing protein [Flavobacteriales bacterium]